MSGLIGFVRAGGKARQWRAIRLSELFGAAGNYLRPACRFVTKLTLDCQSTVCFGYTSLVDDNEKTGLSCTGTTLYFR